jgi:phospholipid/cholesterol/gamma-HCH transport system substrate-binding protein
VRKSLSERNPVIIGIAGLVLAAVIALLAFNADNLPVIGGGTTYTAFFTEAAGLTPGNEVRVAGVTVGKVTGVSLAGNRVFVSFRVKGVWVGDQSTVAIKIKTLLGDKYLALDPLGPAAQNPSVTIPASRTTSPLDVTAAFQQLGSTISQVNTRQLGQSLEAIASAFRNTPPYVRAALTGLAGLSQTIASRDNQIAQLLRGTQQVTSDLAQENNNFRALFGDGNLLLAELKQRQQAIGALLSGTEAMAVQISGLVRDDNAQLAPALRSLEQVTAVLSANQASLRNALALAGTYYRLIGNVLGNGRWFDVYLCGVVPRSYAPTVVPPTGCQPPRLTSQPPGLGGGG